MLNLDLTNRKISIFIFAIIIGAIFAWLTSAFITTTESTTFNMCVREEPEGRWFFFASPETVEARHSYYENEGYICSGEAMTDKSYGWPFEAYHASLSESGEITGVNPATSSSEVLDDIVTDGKQATSLSGPFSVIEIDGLYANWTVFSLVTAFGLFILRAHQKFNY